MGHVEVDPEFLNKVLVIAEENLKKVYEIMNKEQYLKDRAYNILYRALMRWARKAPTKELIEVLEISPDAEDIRWEAEWEIDSMSRTTMLEVAEKLSEKYTEVKEALERAKELLKRAKDLEKKRFTVMPVGKHSVITWENMIALITLVYKICKELEKEGIEP